MSDSIRYYRGIVRIEIIRRAGRKALVKYLEFGIVGPKGLKKRVYSNQVDIVLIRHCWRKKLE